MEESKEYLLQLFLMEVQDKDGNSSRDLLYGWCLPVTEQLGRRNERGAWKADGDRKCRFPIRYLYLSATKVEQLFASGAEQTSLNKLLDEVLGEHDLNLNPQHPGEWIVRDNVWYPPEAQGYMSPPFSNQGVSCTSLFRINKGPVFEMNSKGAIQEHLKQQTGITFTGVDAGRLGNIELFDLHDLDSMRVYVPQDQRGVPNYRLCVQLGKDAYCEHHSFLVRSRLTNACAVVSERCQYSSRDDLVRGITVEAGEPISRFEVQLFTWDDELQTGGLLLEESASILSGASVTLSATEMSGNIAGDPKLSKISSPRLKKDVEALSSFSKGQVASQFKVNSSGANIFRESVYNAYGLASKQQPVVLSEGHFFARGLGDPADPTNQYIGFRKWFKNIVGKNGLPAGGTAFIVDPYFNEVGLGMLMQLDDMGYRYTILLNTRKKERSGLNEFLHRNREFLKHRHIEIYDLLRSRDADSLHDRYLMLSNVGQGYFKGFHLSNSLDGACENHPFLITPIPSDVLPLVQEYIEEIKGHTDPVKLWPPEPTETHADPSASEVDIEVFKTAFNTLAPGNISSKWGDVTSAVSNSHEAECHFWDNVHLLNASCHALVAHMESLMVAEFGSINPDPADVLFFEAFNDKTFDDLVDDLNLGQMHPVMFPNYEIYFGINALLLNGVEYIDDLLSKIHEQRFARYHRMILTQVAINFGSMAVVENAIKSHFPVLRVAGIKSVFDWVRDGRTTPFSMDEFDSHLSSLDTDEQLSATAFFLGFLWKVYERVSQEASAARVELKERLLSRIKTLWPNEIDLGKFDRLMQLCDRAVGGHDTVIIANELLIPLAEDGRVSYELVGRYWFGAWETAVGDKGNSAQSDMLSGCLAWFFVQKPDLSNDFRKSIEELVQRCFRVVRHPLAYSIDHKKASASDKSIIKVATFIMQCRTESLSCGLEIQPILGDVEADVMTYAEKARLEGGEFIRDHIKVYEAVKKELIKLQEKSDG